MLSYMKRLNLPIALGGEWRAENFDVQSLFQFDPELAFSLFFDFLVQRRSSGQKITLLNGKGIFTWKYYDDIATDMLDIMKLLKADKRLTEEAVADFKEFLRAKLPLEISAGIVQGVYGFDGFAAFENKPELSWHSIYKTYLVSIGYNASNYSQGIYLKPLIEKLSAEFEQLSLR